MLLYFIAVPIAFLVAQGLWTLVAYIVTWCGFPKAGAAIFVESSLLTTVVDEEKPLPPHIPAFYAEDARVRFSSLWHATPKRPQLRPSPADYDPLSLHATGYPPQGVVWF